jgi:FdhE protein
MVPLDLRDDWNDLLGRRRELAGSLVPYGPIIDAWAQWPAPGGEPEWDAATCEERWRRGEPVLPQRALDVTAADVEDVVAVAMEAVTATRPDEAGGMRRLADEWDAGRVEPAAFLPTRGGIGDEAARRLGIRTEIVAFLAYAGLRPALEWALTRARDTSPEGVWTLGICPFCGAPPGFGDIVEDGRLRLSCHLCGGAWIFSRVRCPLCGSGEPRDLARLEPGGKDEKYAISACTRCKGYVKHIDRRERWNARTALVEDWGSPHLDLAARKAGYWRPLPTLLEILTP